MCCFFPINFLGTDKLSSEIGSGKGCFYGMDRIIYDPKLEPLVFLSSYRPPGLLGTWAGSGVRIVYLGNTRDRTSEQLVLGCTHHVVNGCANKKKQDSRRQKPSSWHTWYVCKPFMLSDDCLHTTVMLASRKIKFINQGLQLGP